MAEGTPTLGRPQDPSLPFGVRRSIPKDPISPETLTQLRKWLVICGSSHRKCTSSERVLPTRLIDLRESDHLGIVRLVETLAMEDQLFYATLSHRWGISQPVTTTTGTLGQRRQGILELMLPRSFRDVFRICQNLPEFG
jgi:hypothetical protein